MYDGSLYDGSLRRGVDSETNGSLSRALLGGNKISTHWPSLYYILHSPLLQRYVFFRIGKKEKKKFPTRRENAKTLGAWRVCERSFLTDSGWLTRITENCECALKISPRLLESRIRHDPLSFTQRQSA